MVAVACLLLALSSGATALTVGHLRPTWWSCRTALVCREADATLLDPANGKTLKCLIAGTVVVEVPGAEDEVYGALYPADTPITLAQMEDDALVPLMEAEERALFSMAQRACKDMDIELLDTAALLTAGSGLDELLINADDMADADAAYEEDEDEAEEALVLTAFQHEARPTALPAPPCPSLPLAAPCCLSLPLAAPCCPLLLPAAAAAAAAAAAPAPLQPPCRGSRSPSPRVDAAAAQGEEVYVMKPLDPMVPQRLLSNPHPDHSPLTTHH